jgi:hypothetical protein
MYDVVVAAGPILKNSESVLEASLFKDCGFASPLDFGSH